jgi:hypothetical protein
MEIEIFGKLVDGEIVPVNEKGCETIEIDVSNDINVLSMDRDLRLIGLNKNGLYKMTRKSWKALKKYLNRTNQMWRYAN